jgi:holo-[acyl-carrier protein] synthase
MNIGIDIVEVKRISKLIKNGAFLKRVFTPGEIAYCSKRVNRAEHYGVRFAAKEAVWKALGMSGISLKDISVKNLPNGKPEALIKGKKRKDIAISLSHTKDYAAAVAVVKGKNK